MLHALCVIFLTGLSFAGAIVSALAQGNAPVRSGTYYEDQATNSTTSSAQVTLAFAQTPTDQYFNVMNVGCRLRTKQLLVQGTLFIGTTLGNTDINRKAPFTLGTGILEGGYYDYSFNSTLFFKYGPGRYPTIILSFASGTPEAGAYCTINGTLTPN